MAQRFPFTVFGGVGSGAGSASTDTSGRPSASGLKPGTSASLFNVTAGGSAIETVTVDAQGKATFTAVKQPGQTYVIDGIARLDAGIGQVVAPAAPIMTLTAGNGQVSIAWTDGANGGSAITSHGIYRGTTSGNLQLVGFFTGGSPYIDAGLANGVTYFYRISAKNGAGESVLSAQASVTPAAEAPLWTPAMIPASALVPAYNLALASGRLTNAQGKATEAGSVDGTYRATGPRGQAAFDIGQDGASVAMPGPNVPAGYYVLADFDSYTQDANVNANGVGGQPGDYGFLWNGRYDRTRMNDPRPYYFLKHNGQGGNPYIANGNDTSALTPFKFPAESAIALILRYGADGSGWQDINGERSATKAGIGTQSIEGGIVLGSPGTEGATTPRIQIRQFRVLLDNYPGAAADVLRWQGWSAWTYGYQRQLHPNHPYRYGPPLADGTARAPLTKPGLSRRRSVYVGYAAPAEVTKWATAMGVTKPTMANDHGDYTSWASMVSSGKNAADVWSGAGYTGLTMTVPLTVNGTTLSQAAAGAGDTEHTNLIAYYKAKFPTGPRIYRVGHESGVWDDKSGKFPWSPGNPANGSVADWLAAWAHKIALIRAADPGCIIALNHATGRQAIAWTLLIPPASQWDLLLIDGYNEVKSDDFTSQTGWVRFLSSVMNIWLLGAEQLIQLAEKNGKPWGFAEYGSGCGGTGANANYPQRQGGDSPDYPGFMAALMRGGSGPMLGYAEQPCTDDAPYEVTDPYYSSRTYMSQPPQTSAPADARDAKPNMAAGYKMALAA